MRSAKNSRSTRSTRSSVKSSKQHLSEKEIIKLNKNTSQLIIKILKDVENFFNDISKLKGYVTLKDFTDRIHKNLIHFDKQIKIKKIKKTDYFYIVLIIVHLFALYKIKVLEPDSYILSSETKKQLESLIKELYKKIGIDNELNLKSIKSTGKQSGGNKPNLLDSLFSQTNSNMRGGASNESNESNEIIISEAVKKLETMFPGQDRKGLTAIVARTQFEEQDESTYQRLPRDKKKKISY